MRKIWIGVVSILLSVALVNPVNSQAITMTKKQAQEVTETVQKTMPTEQRVSDLEDAAIYYYWNGGQLKKNEKKVFKGITIKSNFDVIEQLFKEAIKIDPQNLNLQMDLASTYRMQNNNAAAAKMWQNILKKDPTNFDARLKLAAFSSVTRLRMTITLPNFRHRTQRRPRLSRRRLAKLMRLASWTFRPRYQMTCLKIAITTLLFSVML